MSTPTFLTRFFALLAGIFAPATALAQNNGIFLMEPIAGQNQIPVDGGGLGAFSAYFGLIYPWLVGLGAGVAVLMAVVGGIQIIQAGSDQAKVSAGKNRLLLSLGGLLIVLLSSTILNTLNPFFFR